MATQTHGSIPEIKPTAGETAQAELYKKVGLEFPVLITVQDGKVVQVKYEDEWQTGGTEPIVNDEGEVTGYREDYEKQKLTAAQKKVADEYIQSIL